MRAIHRSYPVGGVHEGTLKMECPYSLSLRWRWRDKYHSVDVVAYGPLEVNVDPG
jgi:hypothetical protein